MAEAASRLMSGKRILVVEDEYFLAQELESELEDLGVEVLGPVATVDHALALIHDGAGIDAAILDINLQGEMVFPVADLLLREEIPFVFATGYEAQIVPERYPGFVLCRKPAKLNEIAQALFGDRSIKGAS